MILASLRELAQREDLLANPDYEPKPVAWIIALDESGVVLSVIPTAGDETAGKKRTAKVMEIPRRRPGKTGILPPADFLVDKSEYILGVEPKGVRSKEALLVRLGLYREEVLRAQSETRSAALAAVLRFIEDQSQRDRAAAIVGAVGYASNDLFAFEYEGRLVHDRPEVRDYFSRLRREGQQRDASCCVVCGMVAQATRLHPPIRLPGGQTGLAVVSFNQNAFESYGLSGNENAPVCQDCADAYTTALKRLLSDRYPDPNRPGEPLPRRFVRLSADTTAIYWADEEAGILDLLTDYFNAPRVESVGDLLVSAKKGRPPGSVSNRFYCLILTGGQGRAILRGVHTGSVAEVERNVAAYFESIGIGSEQPMPLWALLRSLVLQGKLENLPPGLAGEVFVAILFGRPFPQSLLARAVARCRAEQKVTRERAALLRAYLIRNRQMEVSVGLDRENVRPGYRLGRLMAVLERIQGAAQGNPNKTVVDRYYGAASTRPATVFPGLIKLALHHLSKLEGGLQAHFHKRLAEVLDAVTAFPPTLSLEEQGSFALGYYHQRQEFFTKQSSAPVEAEAEEGGVE